MRIIVDSSALVAIAKGEPEREQFISAIADAKEALCSTVTIYETGTVLMKQKPDAAHDYAIQMVASLGLQIVPFTMVHMAIALEAYRRYGKGLGDRPYLNLGDCIIYALAKSLDAPLLFKGNDFPATDIQAVAVR